MTTGSDDAWNGIGKGGSPLRPSPTIQKYLISSTSGIFGAFGAPGIEIHQAWPPSHDRVAMGRLSEGPLSRGAFVLAFETQPVDSQNPQPIQNLEPFAELICSYLSVLYGKRFDSHGALEWSGLYGMPDSGAFGAACMPELPWNSHKPRADFPIPLRLSEFERALPLFQIKGGAHARSNWFASAARFYLRALQASERDPEVAYLHLIMAGETLSSAMQSDKEQPLDPQMKSALCRIHSELDGGEKLVKLIRGRLSHIKSKFVTSILELVDAEFFDKTESTNRDIGALRSNNFRTVVSAAYDLRSNYVHTGAAFRTWVQPTSYYWLGEINPGQPVVGDKKMATILRSAPTFIGLERVIRYCLLKAAENFGLKLVIAQSDKSGSA